MAVLFQGDWEDGIVSLGDSQFGVNGGLIGFGAHGGIKCLRTTTGNLADEDYMTQPNMGAIVTDKPIDVDWWVLLDHTGGGFRYIHFFDGANDFKVHITSSGKLQVDNRIAVGQLNPGDWQHIALLQPSPSEWELYLDGVLIDKGTKSEAFADFYIGQGNVAVGGGVPFGYGSASGFEIFVDDYTLSENATVTGNLIASGDADIYSSYADSVGGSLIMAGSSLDTLLAEIEPEGLIQCSGFNGLVVIPAFTGYLYCQGYLGLREMGGFSLGMKNLLLEAISRGIATGLTGQIYVQMHNGSCGELGMDNVANGGKRERVYFDAPDSGSVFNNDEVRWTDLTDTETVTMITLWDSSSGGIFIGSSDLPEPRGVDAGGDFFVLAGDIQIDAL